MQGFIKFYRSYLENPIITKDAEHLAVWTYILCSACFEKAEALFGGKITLMPGQALMPCGGGTNQFWNGQNSRLLR